MIFKQISLEDGSGNRLLFQEDGRIRLVNLRSNSRAFMFISSQEALIMLQGNRENMRRAAEVRFLTSLADLAEAELLLLKEEARLQGL